MPMKMPAPALRAYRFARRLLKKIFADDIPGLAMQLAYALLMAAFPFMIIMASVYGHLAFTHEAEFNFFSALPRETSAALKSVLTGIMQHRTAEMLSLNAMLLVISASFAVNPLIKGLNRAYGCRETRGPVKLLIISVLFTVALVLIAVVAIAIAVFDYKPVRPELSWLMYAATAALETGAVFLVMLLIYFYIPNRRGRVREALPGAAAATGGWIAATYIYTLIMDRFNVFTMNYGSIAGIIMLLVWLNVVTTVILACAELNSALRSPALRGGGR